MSTNRFAFATAAALAAAVLSACSGTTYEATPRQTVAVNPVGATDSVPPVVRWQDVTGQVTLPRDSEGAQFGATPLPGIGFAYRDAAQEMQLCTLGPAVVSGPHSGSLTAGHCSANLADSPAELSAAPDVATSPQIPVGNVTQAADDDAAADSAAIWTGKVPAGAARIAGHYPVVGVLTPAAVRTLPPRTPVCLDGAKSGVVCSPLLTAAGDRIRYTHATEAGDSGAAVFVVDRRGNASLIGIHSGFDPKNRTVGEATFLETALARLNAQAVVDPNAAVVPGSMGYSSRVTAAS